MRYAKIKNGKVENLLDIHFTNAAKYTTDHIPVEDRPVEIGDTYDGRYFYREGKMVRTELELTNEQLYTASSTALKALKETCTRMDEPPMATAGAFIYGAQPWEAGREYERYDLFQYNNAVGWVKQAHTSQETWPPFSVGSEALYGARPVSDENRVYQYVYNMAVDVGMLVYDAEDNKIYRCIQATSDLLYAPHLASSLFEVVD